MKNFLVRLPLLPERLYASTLVPIIFFVAPILVILGLIHNLNVVVELCLVHEHDELVLCVILPDAVKVDEAKKYKSSGDNNACDCGGHMEDRVRFGWRSCDRR